MRGCATAAQQQGVVVEGRLTALLELLPLRRGGRLPGARSYGLGGRQLGPK